MNRAQQQQQQQHQLKQQQQRQQTTAGVMRSSSTMPQLKYTQADIQEQYLSATRVRQENRVAAEQQRQASKRLRIAAGGGGGGGGEAAGGQHSELRQSVKLKRSQQLAKFDDGAESTTSHDENDEPPPPPLEQHAAGRHHQVREHNSTSSRDSRWHEQQQRLAGDGGSGAGASDLKRKRSNSASRLLSACFSIPSQLASSIGHQSGGGGGHSAGHHTGARSSSPSSKSRASSILAHFRLGGGGGDKSHRRSAATTSELDYGAEAQTGDRAPQMRPLSNSRTLGNMQQLRDENNNAPEQLEPSHLGRLKHVSFGGGGGSSSGLDSQQQQQQQQRRQQDLNSNSNVIANNKQHQQVTAGKMMITPQQQQQQQQVICRQPISSSRQTAASSAQGVQQRQQVRNQPTMDAAATAAAVACGNPAAFIPPRPPAFNIGGGGGSNMASISQQPASCTIYKRLPAVPMRTQATQTEITAYHLTASPLAGATRSSAHSPSLVSNASATPTATSGPRCPPTLARAQQPDTPSQSGTPTISSTLATTTSAVDLVSGSNMTARQRQQQPPLDVRAPVIPSDDKQRPRGRHESYHLGAPGSGGGGGKSAPGQQGDDPAPADSQDADLDEADEDGGNLNASLLESSSCSRSSSAHSLVGHDSALADTLQCDLKIGSLAPGAVAAAAAAAAAVAANARQSSPPSSSTSAKGATAAIPAEKPPSSTRKTSIIDRVRVCTREDVVAPVAPASSSARGDSCKQHATKNMHETRAAESEMRAEIEPPNRFKDAHGRPDPQSRGLDSRGQKRTTSSASDSNKEFAGNENDVDDDDDDDDAGAAADGGRASPPSLSEASSQTDASLMANLHILDKIDRALERKAAATASAGTGQAIALGGSGGIKQPQPDAQSQQAQSRRSVTANDDDADNAQISLGQSGISGSGGGGGVERDSTGASGPVAQADQRRNDEDEATPRDDKQPQPQRRSLGESRAELASENEAAHGRQARVARNSLGGGPSDVRSHLCASAAEQRAIARPGADSGARRASTTSADRRANDDDDVQTATCIRRGSHIDGEAAAEQRLARRLPSLTTRAAEQRRDDFLTSASAVAAVATSAAAAAAVAAGPRAPKDPGQQTGPQQSTIRANNKSSSGGDDHDDDEQEEADEQHEESFASSTAPATAAAALLSATLEDVEPISTTSCASSRSGSSGANSALSGLCDDPMQEQQAPDRRADPPVVCKAASMDDAAVAAAVDDDGRAHARAELIRDVVVVVGQPAAQQQQLALSQAVCAGPNEEEDENDDDELQTGQVARQSSTSTLSTRHHSYCSGIGEAAAAAIAADFSYDAPSSSAAAQDGSGGNGGGSGSEALPLPAAASFYDHRLEEEDEEEGELAAATAVAAVTSTGRSDRAPSQPSRPACDDHDEKSKLLSLALTRAPSHERPDSSNNNNDNDDAREHGKKTLAAQPTTREQKAAARSSRSSSNSRSSSSSSSSSSSATSSSSSSSSSRQTLKSRTGSRAPKDNERQDNDDDDDECLDRQAEGAPSSWLGQPAACALDRPAEQQIEKSRREGEEEEEKEDEEEKKEGALLAASGGRNFPAAGHQDQDHKWALASTANGRPNDGNADDERRRAQGRREAGGENDNDARGHKAATVAAAASANEKTAQVKRRAQEESLGQAAEIETSGSGGVCGAAMETQKLPMKKDEESSSLRLAPVSPGSEPEDEAGDDEKETRRASSPSPPTTVSELDLGEELSTPSFVHNYKRCLEDQVGELADAFTSGLIGECLAVVRGGGNAAETHQKERGQEKPCFGRTKDTPASSWPFSCSASASSSTSSSSASSSASSSSPSSSTSSSSSSSSSAASTTTTTSIGGASYACLDNGKIERRAGGAGELSSRPVPGSSSGSGASGGLGKPQLPRKPAHLQATAASAGVPAADQSSSSGSGATVLQSAAPSGEDTTCAAQTSARPCASDEQQEQQERAAAVAITATSIAAALHQTSQQQQQSTQSGATVAPANAITATTTSGATKVADTGRGRDSGEIATSSGLVGTTTSEFQASDQASQEAAAGGSGSRPVYEEVCQQQRTASNRASSEEEDLDHAQQSLLELSTVSEASDEAALTWGETSVDAEAPPQAQQPTKETDRSQGASLSKRGGQLVKQRSESFEVSASLAAAATTTGAQVSQAPVKRRRSSSSSERQTGHQMKLAGTAASSLSRSSPVDCPYPHDIAPLPSPPISMHSSSMALAGASAGSAQQLVAPLSSSSASGTTTGSTAIAPSTASARAPPLSAPATSGGTQQQPALAQQVGAQVLVAGATLPSKRLSHDDTMEAIEDDVEGEEQELKLLEELQQQRQSQSQSQSQSQTQSPEASYLGIAPPAGFCSATSGATGSGQHAANSSGSSSASTTSRQSSLLGRPGSVTHESIQEEAELDCELDDEHHQQQRWHEAEKDEQEEEEEESSISVSQQHGVVITKEVSGAHRHRRSTSGTRPEVAPVAPEEASTSQRATNAAKVNQESSSSIQMKRLKESHSGSSSSSASSSSSSSTTAHATPISSATSTPSKSSAVSSGADSNRSGDKSESQCEPLMPQSTQSAQQLIDLDEPATQSTAAAISQEPHGQVKQAQVEPAITPQSGNAAKQDSKGETKETGGSSSSAELATHAILEHMSRRHPSLAAATAALDEPPVSLELCRSIDPQQRRASWRRESETSRVGSSSSSAATAVAAQSPSRRNLGELQVTRDENAQTSAAELAPTGTMKRRKQQQQQQPEADEQEAKIIDKTPPPQPLAVETIPMQLDAPRNEERQRQLAANESTTAAAAENQPPPPPPPVDCHEAAKAQPSSEASLADPQGTPQTGSGKRRPTLRQLKSPAPQDQKQAQQQQQQQHSSHSFDRTDADGSICSSCSCMEASFDQSAAPSTVAGSDAQKAPAPAASDAGGASSVGVSGSKVPPGDAGEPAAGASQQPQQHKSTATTSSGAGKSSGSSTAWMSQEEGTVYTENYWLSHWLYISEREEAEIWRRAIDMSNGSGGGGSSSTSFDHQSVRQQNDDVDAAATTTITTKMPSADCLPANMSETASTSSERSFNSRYKSTTRKMIHRRASVEMYKRIMGNNLRKEKRIEISRSSVGEFGFRIHGSRPVVVSAIERGTSAETCGLQVGDVIYAINDTNILDMAHSDVVRLAHQADSSASLVLDLIPTNGFLQKQQRPVADDGADSKNAANRKRADYEPTVTGHLMRLSASTAQPLLVQLQEQIAAEGGLASAQQRAAKLNRVMRRAWRPRYFVLRSDNCLYWYKSARAADTTIEPLGGLNLQGFSATLTDEFSEPTYVIRLVKYGGQPHYLGSGNLCDIQTWVDAINRAATEANQCDPYMKRTLVLARGKPGDIREPDCAGWLYKFSHKRGGGAHWRAAFFVLKDACLYLFKSQRPELVDQASAVYYLHGYRVRSKHIEHKRYTFELVPPNRKTIKPMFLMASNEIDKKRWIAALEYSIDRWIEIN